MGLESYKRKKLRWIQWFTPVILATWEAELRRITVWGQCGQKVHETFISTIGGHSSVHKLGGSQSSWEGQKVKLYVQNNQSKNKGLVEQ
jgi:hypothetical protein